MHGRGVVVVVIVAGAVLAGIARGQPLPHVTDAKSTERGTDVPGAFCGDFWLTDGEAEWALNEAMIIDTATHHQEYLRLPCFVRGRARMAEESIRWELRAGGDGTVWMPDGSDYLIGCPPCRDRFGATK